MTEQGRELNLNEPTTNRGKSEEEDVDKEID